MFAKPFRIKSQTAIRSSDRKKIRADVSKAYPQLSDDALSSLFPNKEEMSAMKVYSHSGENIMVYCLKKNPIFFEMEKVIYPTVYTLWQHPDLLPVLTTQVDKPIKGVLAGHHKSPLSGSHGDQLEPPNLGPVLLSSLVDDDDVTDDDQYDGGECEDDVNQECGGMTSHNDEVTSELDEVTDAMEGAAMGEDAAGEEEEEEEEGFQETPETMDSLLYECFMYAMLAEVKADDLPLLTSKLLRTHMVPWCPPGRSLDPKKSSYKKLGKFLHAMVKRNLIHMKELSKGVESICDVNRGHEEFKSFRLPEKPAPPPVEEATPTKTFAPPKLEELYAVSGNTVPIFRVAGVNKGTPLTAIEVRKHVKTYVTANKLTVDNDPRLITLDGILSDALLNKGERDTTHLHWDQLFNRCMEKMSAVIRITNPGQEPRIVKGKLQNIQLSVVQRAGNKKVTLVDNLDQFGIDESVFAHDVQIGVAGSTAVQQATGKKGLQVMVQGNQVVFIADMLMGKYGLNKKYITGLDKAPKGKKKR